MAAAGEEDERRVLGDISNTTREIIVAVHTQFKAGATAIESTLSRTSLPVPSKRSIWRVIKRNRDEGSPRKKPRGGNHKQNTVTPEERNIICTAQSQNASLTLKLSTTGTRRQLLVQTFKHIQLLNLIIIYNVNRFLDLKHAYCLRTSDSK